MMWKKICLWFKKPIAIWNVDKKMGKTLKTTCKSWRGKIYVVKIEEFPGEGRI